MSWFKTLRHQKLPMITATYDGNVRESVHYFNFSKDGNFGILESCPEFAKSLLKEAEGFPYVVGYCREAGLYRITIFKWDGLSQVFFGENATAEEIKSPIFHVGFQTVSHVGSLPIRL